MARYELILRLDRALWLTIILEPLLTPKRVMESSKIHTKVKNILELAKYVAKGPPSNVRGSQFMDFMALAARGSRALTCRQSRKPCSKSQHIALSPPRVDSSKGPNRVNRAHWPTKEHSNKKTTWKNRLRWPQIGTEDLFPTNPDLADILGDMDFDSENFYFWDLLGSQISGLGPAWARLCLLYTSPSPRDKRQSRMPSSA